ncbi:Uncharacterised protein [uncultured archaeon]|nr:Uncharacterised protein [uncultured archaeon]
MGERDLLSILGACVIGASSIFLGGCGKDSSNAVRLNESKGSSSLIRLEENRGSSNLIRLDVGKEQSVSVLTNLYRVRVGVSSSPSGVDLHPSVVFSFDNEQDVKSFQRDDSVVYLVTSVPLSGTRVSYSSERLDLSSNDLEKKKAISIARKNTLTRGTFDSDQVSVYALRGTNRFIQHSTWQTQYGVRTYFEGIGRSLSFDYSPNEQGIRAFIFAEMKFNTRGQNSEVDLVFEGAIAPPWSEELEGSWDCPAHGKFFRFRSDEVLSSNSLFRRGSSITYYPNTYFDKSNKIIYLDAQNLKGERIKISEGKQGRVMAYFGADKIMPKGEEMVRMSEEAANRKY